MPVLDAQLSVRGDLEERYITTMGLPKGTPIADLKIPYQACLIALVSGAFPPDGARACKLGSFELKVTQGRFSLVTTTRVKQFDMPSGDYIVDCKLYDTRKENLPDLVIMLRRVDRVPIALLRSSNGF